MLLRYLVMWMNRQRNSTMLLSIWKEDEEEGDLFLDLFLV